MNSEGLTCIQVWVPSEGFGEEYIGTLYKKDDDISYSVDLDAEDIHNCGFRPANIHFREITDKDTAEMVKAKEEGNKINKIKQDALKYFGVIHKE